MAGGGIVATVEIAAQLAAVMCDPGLVVPDVAVQTSVPVPGKGWRHTHSYQQKNSSNRAFHTLSLRPHQAATEWEHRGNEGVSSRNPIPGATNLKERAARGAPRIAVKIARSRYHAKS